MILEIRFSYNDHFRHPTIEIGIDEQVLYAGQVENHFTFDCQLNNGPHTLWVHHHSKQEHETNDQHDTHVHIQQILFDGVDLDQLDYCRLTHRGRFYPKYTENYIATCTANGQTLPDYISPNHYLGHNGTWELDFNTPELLWIITEQNPSGMHLEDTMFSTSTDVLNEIKSFFKL